MSTRVREVFGGLIGQLRYEPVARRVRARLGSETIVDSTRALLVWEPRRVVPTYAVPADDIAGEVRPMPGNGILPVDAGTGFALQDVSRMRVLDPRIPFAAHTADGQSLEVRVADHDRVVAGFRLSDGDLAGYVLLDFDGVDQWLEEDDEVVSHPRDPFHRIDVFTTARDVQVSAGVPLLASSRGVKMLFETMLPARYYFPREDVRVELLPGTITTTCAYKGRATHYSVDVGDRIIPNIAWSYEDPLSDGLAVAHRIAFYTERLDLVIDGVMEHRPATPWSDPPDDRP